MFDLIKNYNRPTLQESTQKILNASGDSFLSMERQNSAFWSANLSETLILAIVTDIRVDGHTCKVLISRREKFGVIIKKKTRYVTAEGELRCVLFLDNFEYFMIV